MGEVAIIRDDELWIKLTPKGKLGCIILRHFPEMDIDALNPALDEVIEFISGLFNAPFPNGFPETRKKKWWEKWL
jgi:hypothetical protein